MLLPSNASMNHFENNCASHFKINLPYLLHLKNYEVAMDSIYYTKDLKTVLAEEIEIVFRPTIPVQFSKVDLIPDEAFLTIQKKLTVNSYSNLLAMRVNVIVKPFPEQLHWEENRHLLLTLTSETKQTRVIEFDEEYIEQLGVRPVKDWKVIEGIPMPLMYLEHGKPLHFRLDTKAISKKLTCGIKIKDRPVTANLELVSGYYATGADLVEMINQQFHLWMNNDYRGKPIAFPNIFKYNRQTKRISINFPDPRIRRDIVGHIEYVNLKGAKGLLGFVEATTRKTITAPYPPELTRGIQTVYMYSNIVEPIHVGDTMAPLLATIPLSRENHGVQDYMVVHNRFYNPVIADPFQTLEIDLRDDAGDKLTNALIGKTVIRLHFRKISVH